ncbi:MAG: pyridoxine 5'-phosphate synthase [Myxococcales bacterium]|nr:pyridoxine 5'-phosphate synthase [Myxococcales bacterium]
MPVRLHINIDHVATVRNARGTRYPDPTYAGATGRAATKGVAPAPLSRTSGPASRGGALVSSCAKRGSRFSPYRRASVSGAGRIRTSSPAASS